MLPFLEPPSNILRPETKLFADEVSRVAGTPLSSAEKKIIDRLLVKQLLSANLWASQVVFYPIIGGSAAAHSINLVAPGTYSIIWSGTVTHDALGATSNGVTGQGNTQLATNLLGQDNSHASGYCGSASTNGVIIGNARLPADYFILRGLSNFQFRNAFAGTDTATSTAVSGFVAFSRTNSLNYDVRVGSTNQTFTRTSAAFNTDTIRIFALNSVFAAVNVRMVSLGSGLTTAQILNLESICNGYQAALGRLV